MRNRGSCIIVKDNEVVLIKRIREGHVYNVFPGGGIEEGESPEEAAVREANEELGIKVNIQKLFAQVEYMEGIQYYFLAEIVNGEICAGKGEEYTDVNRNRGEYIPMWVKIDELKNMDVRPKEVAERVALLRSV